MNYYTVYNFQALNNLTNQLDPNTALTRLTMKISCIVFKRSRNDAFFLQRIYVKLFYHDLKLIINETTWQMSLCMTISVVPGFDSQ